MRWLSLCEFALGAFIVVAHNLSQRSERSAPAVFARSRLAAPPGRVADNRSVVARQLATHRHVRLGGRGDPHSPRGPGNRAADGPLLGTGDATERLDQSRDTGNRPAMAANRVDLCRLRRRDRVPRLPVAARGRSRRGIEELPIGRPSLSSRCFSATDIITKVRRAWSTREWPVSCSEPPMCCRGGTFGSACWRTASSTRSLCWGRISAGRPRYGQVNFGKCVGTKRRAAPKY